MSYYRLDFPEHPAEEGDRWQSKARTACPACGLRVVPFAAEFPVPDDSVVNVHAGVWEWVDTPFLYVAGLILARADVASQLASSGLGGFSFREAEVTFLEEGDERSLPSFRWMVAGGRCQLHDIWDRVVTTCQVCGYPTTERLTAVQRRIRLRAPFPAGIDVCRGREDAGGIIVTDRFRDFCQAQIPGVDDAIRLVPVPLEP